MSADPRARGRQPDPGRPASPSVRRAFWLGLAVTFVVMSATALPLCGLMFRCGCTMTTGVSHCNVRHAAGPRCPWCVRGGLAFGLSFLAMSPGILTATYAAAARPRRRSAWLAGLAGTAAYLALTPAAGWVTARAMGYPTWFGLPVG